MSDTIPIKEKIPVLECYECHKIFEGKDLERQNMFDERKMINLARCPNCNTNNIATWWYNPYSKKSFIQEINEFERGFIYPHDMHFNPEFWIGHAKQQLDEVYDSFKMEDYPHMNHEFADTILVCWRALQIFGNKPPEEIIRERMNINMDEKGYENIMKKYIDWWNCSECQGGKNE